MSTEMKLPELGENVESGDVLRVLVKPGDKISKDQPVLELETDKATIEVPASAEGVVKEIRVKPGDKVKVGQSLLVIDDDSIKDGGDGAPAEKAEAQQKPAAAEKPAEEKPAEKKPAPEKPAAEAAGPAEEKASAPPPEPEAEKKAAPPEPEPKAEAKAAPPAEPKRRAEVIEMSRAKPAPADAAPAASIPAAPSARRLARELGVNIAEVRGTGPGGRISMDDVVAFARQLLVGASGRPAGEPLPDFSKWGPIERKPMSGVRRTTAHRLTQAWTTIPHVVQYDRADVTSLDTLRKRLSKQSEDAGKSPVTMTAFIVKAIAEALKKFPQFNSSVDLQTDEIIYKQYVHVGIAVDTDRGLLVPVIRDVDTKDVPQLADELARAAEKARGRKLSLDDMRGGSFTVSNLGSLGAGSFAPIINWPEVAILGVSRAVMQPVYVDGQFQPRFLMPLALSYDHRVIDGADGVRFIRWLVEVLEQPALIWLEA